MRLWGDPVYDLAVHLHKMGYQDHERDHVLASWLAKMPVEHSAGWEPDLAIYLAHERIKSAIVDTVRYAQTFARGGGFPYPPETMIDMLTAKQNAARVAWRIPDQLTRDNVKEALDRWTNA